MCKQMVAISIPEVLLLALITELSSQVLQEDAPFGLDIYPAFSNFRGLKTSLLTEQGS